MGTEAQDQSARQPTGDLTASEAQALVAASLAQGPFASNRLLLIKGVSLTDQGLRPARESADLDVLTAPDEINAIVEALASRGWRSYTEDTTAHVIPLHSHTLVHARWPIELDVHHRFPGFLADPQLIFDALWERRQTLEQAHQSVFMPDRNSSILIAALHYERAPEMHENSMADLRERAISLLNADDLADLAELAARTGCADTLRDFLDSLGAPPVGVGTSDPDALAAWNLYRTGGRVTGVAWLEELRRTPWPQRPALLWHALMFTEDELRFKYPDAPGGRKGVWLARYWRVRQAVKALPKARRVMRAHRPDKHETAGH